ncbi:MAG: FmdB family zinc ribbon protein [Acidimicrobiales bacterium]
MPTYEYRCKACGHDLEAVQAFTDDALSRCPACGAEELRKVFGSVGISFKGSGFYKNDSRGKSSTSAPADKSGSDSSSSPASTEGSSESGSSSSSDSSTSTTTPSAPKSDAKTDAKSA